MGLWDHHPASIRQTLRRALLLSLIPILGLQATYLVLSYRRLETATAQALLEHARAARETHQAFLGDVLRQALAIGRHLATTPGLTGQQMNRILAASKAEYTAVRAFSWYDPARHRVVAASTGVVGLDYRERDYIRAIVAGKEWAASDLIVSQAPPRTPIVTIARGIRDEAGTLLGIVIAGIDPARLADVFAAKLAAGTALTVVDRQGREIFRSPPISRSWEQRDLLARWPELRPVLQGREFTGTLPSRADTGEVMTAFVPIPHLGWALGVEHPREEVMAPVRSQVLEQAGVFLLWSGLLYLGTLVFAKSLAAPIQRLRKHVQWLGAEALDREIAAEGPSELRDLAAAFNAMAKEITRRDAALRLSEERLRLALAAAQAGSWEWDLATNVNVWSEELWPLYGLDPRRHPASYDSWRQSIHPADVAQVEEAVQAAAQQGTDLQVEWRVAREGRERWLLSRGKPMRDAEGRTVRYLGIVLDITERKEDHESLERMRDILAEGQKIAHLGTFEYVAATRTTVWSEEEYRIYGLDPADPSPAYEVMLAKCIHPEDAALLHQTFAAALQAGEVYELEHRIVRPDGGVRWVYDRAVPHVDAAGALVRYVGATLDITDRRAAEEALRASLAEKEVLLKEIHHRVKNNLQIVASLLSLEASRARLPEVHAVLRDTRARVQAMALLHEALYRSTTLSQINLATYVPELVRHLQRSMGTPAGLVSVEMRVASLGLPLEQAVPCGLIINELVANTLKHAFPEERRGTVRVDIESAGPHEVAVQVADDGVGLPAGFDPERASTLGIRLVTSLVGQLRGRLTAENRSDSGASFRVVFPLAGGEGLEGRA